jgi:hypothetical protein
VDFYVQQLNVIPARAGQLAIWHAAWGSRARFDPQNRYCYIMGEGYDWHPKLVGAGDRAMLRQSYYATAMSGGYVTVLSMFLKIDKPPARASVQDQEGPITCSASR